MPQWPKLRGISRLDYVSVPPGWRARYTREGVTFSEDFYDAKYGSPEFALEAAKEWYQRATSLLPPMGRRDYAQMKKVTNTSGIVGVRRIKSTVKGHAYWFWTASWTPTKGKKINKQFSINKYGEEGAKKLAIEARRKGLEEIQDEWPEDYWEYRRNTDGTPPDAAHDAEEVYGFEGTPMHREHLARERDRGLRDAKIKLFLEEHGELFCEICGFSFEREYGLLGRNLIEIHHIVPVAKLEPGHKTRVEDLICICANCHLAVHHGDAYVNLQKLQFIFGAKKKDKKSNTAAHRTGYRPSDGL